MSAFGVNPALAADRPPAPAGISGTRRRSTRRAVVENDEYAAFVRRVVAAQGRRIAAGDVEALPVLLDLVDDVDRAARTAVHGLRECGYSWADIATRLGTSRQAAQQRWGGNTSAGAGDSSSGAGA